MTLLGTVLACCGGTVLLGNALTSAPSSLNAGLVPSTAAGLVPPTAASLVPPNAAGSTSRAGGGGSPPVRLFIPALQISADIRPVGVDAHGALRVPSSARVLGWWSGGAGPGSGAGRVVIAGHVDSIRQGPGAFFRLTQVVLGQQVLLRTADGRSRSYRVVARRFYRKEQLPAQVFARTGPPCLVLITCAGPFDRRTGHYRDNFVIYASPA
ncbi:class F sortase [Nonomuraea sp. NPDC004354]